VEGESPKAASAPTGAVFLSYASQDAEAAKRISDALRVAGIEVWFDQSELRGGDAWDRAIRKQIHDCALFVPVISAHSDARHEGYFRREWRLAVERAGDMSERVAFLVPVVIDDTSDSRADVPDRFREVQWTRLPGGDTPPVFVDRIKRLLSPELSPLSAVSSAAPGIGERVPPSRRWNPFLLAIAAVIISAAPVYFWISKHWTRSAAAFAPPPHSIAVLPFVNMSGDKEQEYLSDGLAEELLNSIAEIHELQVAARTSAFSFKGTNTDIATIARKLNVGAVLEGSVRRSGNTVRITTQLIDAVTGFHLWSHTYDRDLGDVLKLETEIAGAVASALKVSRSERRRRRSSWAGRVTPRPSMRTCGAGRLTLQRTGTRIDKLRSPPTRRRSDLIRTMRSRTPTDRSRSVSMPVRLRDRTFAGASTRRRPMH